MLTFNLGKVMIKTCFKPTKRDKLLLIKIFVYTVEKGNIVN